MDDRLIGDSSPAKFPELRKNTIMWVKQCHKPPQFWNGKHSTSKNGGFGDELWHCFTNVKVGRVHHQVLH
jgi:hypothetical protein